MGDMVDLKYSKDELKQRDKSDVCDAPSLSGEERDRYPYGFSMTFNKREVDKLPALQKASAGDTVMIMVKAKITEIGTNEKENDKNTKRVVVQFQKVAVQAEQTKEFAAGFATK